MENKCDKHPIDFRGLNPKEFGNTNYFYQEQCYIELGKEYSRQAEGDFNRPSLKNKVKREFN